MFGILQTLFPAIILSIIKFEYVFGEATWAESELDKYWYWFVLLTLSCLMSIVCMI